MPTTWAGPRLKILYLLCIVHSLAYSMNRPLEVGLTPAAKLHSRSRLPILWGEVDGLHLLLPRPNAKFSNLIWSETHVVSLWSPALSQGSIIYK